MILRGYIFSILYAFLCIAIALGIGKLGVPKHITRKFIHIFVGFEWVILYHYMGAGSVHFLMVCLLFLVLLSIDYKTHLVPAMSSDSDNAPGTVYYAVAMSIMAAVTMFAPDMILPFGVGVFCTSLGDGLAAVVGQSIVKGNPKIWGNKTLFGGLTCFAVCFLVPFVFNSVFSMDLSVFHCLVIAFFAFEIELFIGFGLDNIAITLASAALTHALMYFPWAFEYLVPVIVTPLIVAFAYSKHALTRNGIIAALLVDLAISVSLGNFGFTALITFFVGSVAVDKFKKYYKKRKQRIEPDREVRNDCRDAVQVFSNGFVAAVSALIYLITSKELFLIAFVAALAESFADTAASGIGFISKKVYDPFRFEKCENGISGGMSLLGTLAGLFAAVIVPLVALAFGRINALGLVAVFAAAFLGCIFDSFLGSLFQVKYKCPICSLVLEKKSHCGSDTVKYRGLSFVNNDLVNLLSTVFSALVAMLLYSVI